MRPKSTAFFAVYLLFGLRIAPIHDFLTPAGPDVGARSTPQGAPDAVVDATQARLTDKTGVGISERAFLVAVWERMLSHAFLLDDEVRALAAKNCPRKGIGQL